jgi:hypothetical protein
MFVLGINRCSYWALKKALAFARSGIQTPMQVESSCFISTAHTGALCTVIPERSFAQDLSGCYGDQATFVTIEGGICLVCAIMCDTDADCPATAEELSSH